MNNIIHKIWRFIEIDFQYFRTSLSLKQKISDVIRTDVTLLINLVTKPKNFSSVKIGGNEVFYDTPFATKTLLTTVYDFYLETRKASLLPERPIVLDIGANIGQFVIATKFFYPQAKIYSCEPDKEVFKILERNASSYKEVKVYEYGLSNKSGEAKFFRSDDFSEWSGLQPLEGHAYTPTRVKLKRGDDLFKSLKRIDLLKIDVEGAELQVLEGLTQTIKRCNYILLEASILRSSSDVGSQKVLSFLFNHGFSIEHIGRIFADNSGNYQGAVDILLKNMSYERK